jgi:hypothetical protein
VSPKEIGTLYRLYAAHCVGIARDIADSARKLALLDMAQAWVALAEQAENKREHGIAYETGIERPEHHQA